jgi:putative transposase
MARQIVRSHNWLYTKDKVAKLHWKIANMRKDFLQKLSTNQQISATATLVIIVEDLKIKNMMASGAGAVEKLGKNVLQKAKKTRIRRKIGIFLFRAENSQITLKFRT